MEVITSPRQIPVVQVSDLAIIPSAEQVRQAICNLYKNQEAVPHQFSYVKFPFGILDYDGLKKIQEYHEQQLRRKMESEDKEWLIRCESFCNGINIAKIKQFFEQQVWNKSNKQVCGRNFVGKRWILDSDMDRLLDIANKQYNDTICFASKPSKHLCAFSQIQTKLENILSKGIKTRRILIALHVGRQEDGTTFISNGSLQGNHWSLLAIDVENKSAYYGDSLGWSVPYNLISALEENLHMLECKLGIDIHSCLQDIITINGKHKCLEQCTHFYPLQSCSNICGIIVMCMIAIMTESWEDWCKWNHLAEPEFLLNPSLHGNYLRINALSWVVEEKIDIDTLNKFPSNDGNLKLQSFQATPKNNTYVHVNVTGNQTSAGDMHNEEVPAIENSKPTNSNNNMTSANKNTYNSKTEILSDDDFIPQKRETKQLVDHSSSEDETYTQKKTVITDMLPDNYDYKFIDIFEHDHTGSYHCSFRLKLQSEKDARKWVADYNQKSKETMVYNRSKTQNGKRVVKKLYLRYQHNQRQTGKHTKSANTLKTTHKQHNNKHTNCPAHMTITVLASNRKHNGYLVEVDIKHAHNHLVNVADALRFRPIAKDTKAKYYDLFKQGHSPSSAHLEYETNLMFLDNPHLLAD